MSVKSEDIQRASKLLKLMSTDMNTATQSINKLIDDVNNKEFGIEKGISLLDLKNNSLLTYMANLAYTTVLKLAGNSIDGHKVVDRLIEDRVVIERLGPYENKLKYEIEKYITDARDSNETGDTNGEVEDETTAQGLSVNDFATGDDSEEEADNDEDVDQFTTTVDNKKLTYKVPKVSQNKFVEDSKQNDEDKAQAARRRLLNSAMMQDALYDHKEDPDIIYNSSSLQRKANKKREEIRKYEEDNMTRLTLSKKDKASLKSSYTLGQMRGELLGFSDVGVLDGSSTGGESKGGKKRGRKGSKGSAKKGKKRKFK